MRNKFPGLEPTEQDKAFAEKYMMGEEERHRYAIHGGGFPIKVKGVDAIVGVIVVSGLPQAEDHQIVAETLAAYAKELEARK